MLFGNQLRNCKKITFIWSFLPIEKSLRQYEIVILWISGNFDPRPFILNGVPIHPVHYSNRSVPFLQSCCLMFKNSRFPLIPFRYSAHVLSPILLPRRLPNGKLRRLYPLPGLAVACYQRNPFTSLWKRTFRERGITFRPARRRLLAMSSC